MTAGPKVRSRAGHRGRFRTLLAKSMVTATTAPTMTKMVRLPVMTGTAVDYSSSARLTSHLRLVRRTVSRTT